jgi:hypothetical protein
MIEIPGSEGRGYRIFFHFHRLVLTAFIMEPAKLIKFPWPHNFHTAAHMMSPSQRGLLGNDDPTLPRSWPPPYLLDQTAIEFLLRTMRDTPRGAVGNVSPRGAAFDN